MRFSYLPLLLLAASLELASAKVQATGSQVAPATSDRKQANNRQCQYERLPWEQCQANGVQQRLLKLKQATKTARCEPIKIVRRECKPGCKYQRGQWSAECRDGLRVRMDSLARAPRQAASCEPSRRVTKDCAHTCHYVKSAWSECVDGVRTRSLRLAQWQPQSESQSGTKSESPPRDGCQREKTVKRACRASGGGGDLKEPAAVKTSDAKVGGETTAAGAGTAKSHQ